MKTAKIYRQLTRAFYLMGMVMMLAGMMLTLVRMPVLADEGAPTPESAEPLVEETGVPEESPLTVEEPPAPEAPEVPGGSELETLGGATQEVLPLEVLETPTVDEAPTPEPEVEAVVEEETVVEEEVTELPQAESLPQDVADVVQLLDAEGIVLTNEEGQPIPYASKEMIEAITGQDPFVWDDSLYGGTGGFIGYTTTGSGCPAFVMCVADPTPFQAAVNKAKEGSVIYVAGSADPNTPVFYNEVVTVNTADLSFMGFTPLTDPVDNMTYDNWIAKYTVGYAMVEQFNIFTNVNISVGVSSDKVTLYDDGALQDAFTLMSEEGKVTIDPSSEAAARLYLAGTNDARMFDRADLSSFLYELECGEPLPSITVGTNQSNAKTYTFPLVGPYHPEIIDYYGGGDVGKSRIDLLILAVNLSAQQNWSDTFEKYVYWHLLDRSGIPAGEPAGVADMVQAIRDGVYDGAELTWGIWFLVPTDPRNTQLTFIKYEVPTPPTICVDEEAENYGGEGDCQYNEVTGCMDPEALNYDPTANTNTGVCEYPGGGNDDPGEDDPGDGSSGGGDPGINPPGGGLAAPAGGGAGGAVLIPVTGADLGAFNGMGRLQQWLLNLGMIFLGMGLMLTGASRRFGTD
ncbi:MAG: hypothetical protein HPY76_14925 [Anaerolineae bacterium]|nr:hypothetical protein [Anaerolineae bacterium]